MDFEKKGLILVEKDENGTFREISEISIQARNEIESIKSGASRKIEIKAILPKSLRDAVTLEEVYAGIVVFTMPEDVARKYSLLA